MRGLDFEINYHNMLWCVTIYTTIFEVKFAV